MRFPLLSPLFVPGNRPERFAKAAASGADAIILDLEDAVSREVLDTARQAVSGYIASGPATVPVVVRINAPGSDAGRADLATLQPAPPSAVLVPKFETANAAQSVREALGDQVAVLALVETAAAFENLPKLLRESGVAQAALGTFDLAHDIGCAHESALIDHLRCQIVLASRLAGIAPPLDGVTATVGDDSSVGTAAGKARALGFGGKLCIHPRQVPLVRAAYLPGSAELARAQAIVAACADGVAVLDGQMIDRPIVLAAERVLALAAENGMARP